MPPGCSILRITAWRGIFWVSLPPGILFVIGSFMVAESPRWLLRRGKKSGLRRAAALAHDRSRPIWNSGNAGDVAAEKKKTARSKTNESLSGASTSSHLSWPASFSPAIRPPASTPSSPTTLTFSCRAVSPISPRTGVMSFHVHQFRGDFRVASCWSIARAASFCSRGHGGNHLVSHLHRLSLSCGTEQPARGCATAVQPMVSADQTVTLTFNAPWPPAFDASGEKCARSKSSDFPGRHLFLR